MSLFSFTGIVREGIISPAVDDDGTGVLSIDSDESYIVKTLRLSNPSDIDQSLFISISGYTMFSKTLVPGEEIDFTDLDIVLKRDDYVEIYSIVNEANDYVPIATYVISGKIIPYSPVDYSGMITVAAENSSDYYTALADYICDTEIESVVTTIEAALAQGVSDSKTVHLFPGEYICETPLTIPSDCIMEGHGITETTFRFVGGDIAKATGYPESGNYESGYGVLIPPNASNVHLSNFFVIGDRDIFRFNSAVVMLHGCSYITLDTIHATSNCRNAHAFGIRTTSASTGYMEDINLRRCIVAQSSTFGFVASGGSGVTYNKIIGMTYEECISANTMPTFESNRHYDNPLGDTTLTEMWYPNQWVVGFDLMEAVVVEDVHVKRCYAEKNFEAGFYLEGAHPAQTSLPINILLEDCVARRNGTKRGYIDAEMPNYDQPIGDPLATQFTRGYNGHNDVTFLRCIASDQYIGFKMSIGNQKLIDCKAYNHGLTSYLITDIVHPNGVEIIGCSDRFSLSRGLRIENNLAGWTSGREYVVGEGCIGTSEARYICTSQHTAATATRPSTGADWETVWDADPTTAGWLHGGNPKIRIENYKAINSARYYLSDAARLTAIRVGKSAQFSDLDDVTLKDVVVDSYHHCVEHNVVGKKIRYKNVTGHNVSAVFRYDSGDDADGYEEDLTL